MRLIAAGFATKSMDIHDKSSDWGLTSGLVPNDQSFSKTCKGSPDANIHPHAHGEAEPVKLNLKDSFAKLNGQGHFEHMVEIKSGPCTAFHGLTKYRHFHCDTKNAKVCFLMDSASGEVFWHWRLASPPQDAKKLVPVWVWGYKGTPVTGDYDMWMVAPHITKLSGPNTINSNKDSHGRSAANAYTTEFMKVLNEACGRVDKPVFNHGAEAQNFSFTQAMDKRLVVFPAGTMTPFTITRILLPGILHDLLLHGYVVVRNPKWANGATLGIEDMADAPPEFANDGAVKAGVGALNALKQGAAKTILSGIRAKQSGGAVPFQSDAVWHERYNQLRYFRAVGNGMPDAAKSAETLVLPQEAFPSSGPGSEMDAKESAVKLGKQMEANFGRTGFLMEDGHLSPVDASKTSKTGGSVKQAVQNWGKKN
jgi:hypothetical protein